MVCCIRRARTAIHNDWNDIPIFLVKKSIMKIVCFIPFFKKKGPTERPNTHTFFPHLFSSSFPGASTNCERGHGTGTACFQSRHGFPAPFSSAIHFSSWPILLCEIRVLHLHHLHLLLHLHLRLHLVSTSISSSPRTGWISISSTIWNLPMVHEEVLAHCQLLALISLTSLRWPGYVCMYNYVQGIKGKWITVYFTNRPLKNFPWQNIPHVADVTATKENVQSLFQKQTLENFSWQHTTYIAVVTASIEICGNYWGNLNRNVFGWGWVKRKCAIFISQTSFWKAFHDNI